MPITSSAATFPVTSSSSLTVQGTPHSSICTPRVHPATSMSPSPRGPDNSSVMQDMVATATSSRYPGAGGPAPVPPDPASDISVVTPHTVPVIPSPSPLVGPSPLLSPHPPLIATPPLIDSSSMSDTHVSVSPSTSQSFHVSDELFAELLEVEMVAHFDFLQAREAIFPPEL